MAKDFHGLDAASGADDSNSDREQGREISAREVNRQISADLKKAKLKAGETRRGVRSGVRQINAAVTRHPGDPKAQIADFLRNYVIMSSIGRNRPVSERRRTGYGEGLIGIVDDLRANNIRLSKVTDLSKKHVLVLARYWTIERQQTTATVQNKLSILRSFSRWIGKENLVPEGSEMKEWLRAHGVEVVSWKSTVITQSLAWDQKGVDAQQVIDLVGTKCAFTKAQLQMALAFGLRVKETIQLNPRAADYPQMLRVLHGTKGGMPRDVHYDDDEGIAAWQRQVLARACDVAALNPKGLLSVPGYSLKGALKHFYYVIRSCGISRKDLGVTAHGLRHQYSARRYEQVTGFGAPVNGFGPIGTEEEKRIDLEARKKLSRDLGHHRASVLNAYIGSIPTMNRGRANRIQAWIELTEGSAQVQKALVRAGVGRCWLTGAYATGLDVAAGSKLQMVVQAKMGGYVGQTQFKELHEELDRIIARGVSLSEFPYEGAPAEGLELSVCANLDEIREQQTAQIVASAGSEDGNPDTDWPEADWADGEGDLDV